MPRLSPTHRHAVCPRLTINDLFLFRDLFEGLRNGRGTTEIADELRITLKKCRQLLIAVEKALDIPGEPSGFIRRHAKEKDVDLTPTGMFHAGVRELIDKLAVVVDDCQTRRRRVVVQGSEFSTLWLLPRVLEQSQFLTKHPEVALDIRRAFWHKFITNLEHGRIDLALGPATPHRPNIEQHHLLTVPRALIYHNDHKFAGGRDADHIRFQDLSRETVFVLSGEPIPGFFMRSYLPKPAHGGQHVYLDSISHMYQYVQRNLGVALGYEHRYGPAHEKSLVRAKKLDELDKLPPAAFYLYALQKQHRELSQDAEELMKAILEVAPGL